MSERTAMFRRNVNRVQEPRPPSSANFRPAMYNLAPHGSVGSRRSVFDRLGTTNHQSIRDGPPLRDFKAGMFKQEPRDHRRVQNWSAHSRGVLDLPQSTLQSPIPRKSAPNLQVDNTRQGKRKSVFDRLGPSPQKGVGVKTVDQTVKPEVSDCPPTVCDPATINTVAVEPLKIVGRNSQAVKQKTDRFQQKVETEKAQPAHPKRSWRPTLSGSLCEQQPGDLFAKKTEESFNLPSSEFCIPPIHPSFNEAKYEKTECEKSLTIQPNLTEQKYPRTECEKCPTIQPSFNETKCQKTGFQKSLTTHQNVNEATCEKSPTIQSKLYQTKSAKSPTIQPCVNGTKCEKTEGEKSNSYQQLDCLVPTKTDSEYLMLSGSESGTSLGWSDSRENALLGIIKTDGISSSETVGTDNPATSSNDAQQLLGLKSEDRELDTPPGNGKDESLYCPPDKESVTSSKLLGAASESYVHETMNEKTNCSEQLDSLIPTKTDSEYLMLSGSESGRSLGWSDSRENALLGIIKANGTSSSERVGTDSPATSSNDPQQLLGLKPEERELNILSGNGKHESLYCPPDKESVTSSKIIGSGSHHETMNEKTNCSKQLDSLVPTKTNSEYLMLSGSESGTSLGWSDSRENALLGMTKTDGSSSSERVGADSPATSSNDAQQHLGQNLNSAGRELEYSRFQQEAQTERAQSYSQNPASILPESLCNQQFDTMSGNRKNESLYFAQDNESVTLSKLLGIGSQPNKHETMNEKTTCSEQFDGFVPTKTDSEYLMLSGSESGTSLGWSDSRENALLGIIKTKDGPATSSIDSQQHSGPISAERELECSKFQPSSQKKSFLSESLCSQQLDALSGIGKDESLNFAPDKESVSSGKLLGVGSQSNVHETVCEKTNCSEQLDSLIPTKTDSEYLMLSGSESGTSLGWSDSRENALLGIIKTNGITSSERSDTDSPKTTSKGHQTHNTSNAPDTPTYRKRKASPGGDIEHTDNKQPCPPKSEIQICPRLKRKHKSPCGSTSEGNTHSDKRARL